MTKDNKNKLWYFIIGFMCGEWFALALILIWR